MPESTILALETSQRKGSIALIRRDGESFYSELKDDKRHDNDLMPAISRLFSEASLKPECLEVVGVSAGPGGFTGLRIAISTAKMLALSLNCKVVAVPSALVAAETITGEISILVALASKKNAFWATSLIRDKDGYWQIDSTPYSTSGDDLDLSDVNLIIADKFLPETFQLNICNSGIKIVEPTFDARMCLEVTKRQVAEGKISDPQQLLPIYAREPEAVSLWQARKAKSV